VGKFKSFCAKVGVKHSNYCALNSHGSQSYFENANCNPMLLHVILGSSCTNKYPVTNELLISYVSSRGFQDLSTCFVSGTSASRVINLPVFLDMWYHPPRSIIHCRIGINTSFGRSGARDTRCAHCSSAA
jgi:hypothetical protein